MVRAPTQDEPIVTVWEPYDDCHLCDRKFRRFRPQLSSRGLRMISSEFETAAAVRTAYHPGFKSSITKTCNFPPEEMASFELRIEAVTRRNSS
jgi:hypothetical protein